MNNLSRRVFLERVGACTGGAAVSGLLGRTAGARDSSAPSPAVAWNPPPLLTHPNILLIMVDQMRVPMWLGSSQLTLLNQQFLPNIFGRLRNNSYNFQQYYVAATVCTASRATLLTGLYAPQTSVYIGDGNAPAMNPAFPTWAAGIANLNPAYSDNCWWFGKWHLSRCNSPDPLEAYGFRTRTYPGGASGNPSPDGAPNEGANGGLFQNRVFASDAQIAGDFTGWLQGQPSFAQPWCASVSLVNPHDIAVAPAWLQSSPPPGLPSKPVYFPPPSFGPPSGPSPLLTALPSPWNYENLRKVTGKPPLQLAYLNWANQQVGTVADWILFLNQYYWLQNYVDRQVGAILDALEDSGQAGNTIVLFTSDHGEYGGSHGLHGKGFAVYDESLRVPLFVKFPGRAGCTAMSQMCSSVDIFGLLCDLATSGGGLWQHGSQAYPDLVRRQSLWSFLYQNAPESRIAPALGIPYIFHTYDAGAINGKNGHIVCLRTKADPNNLNQPGAKLAIYSAWDACSTIPNGAAPDCEFYDYNPGTTYNLREMGNDYLSPGAVTQSAIAQYREVLGNWGPPATGLIAAELNAPLTGIGRDGKPLTEAQSAARQEYFSSVSSACP